MKQVKRVNACSFTIKHNTRPLYAVGKSPKEWNIMKWNGSMISFLCSFSHSISKGSDVTRMWERAGDLEVVPSELVEFSWLSFVLFSLLFRSITNVVTKGMRELNEDNKKERTKWADMEVPSESFCRSSWDSRTCYPWRTTNQGLTDDEWAVPKDLI